MKNLEKIITQTLAPLQPSAVIRKVMHFEGDQLVVKDRKYDLSSFMKIGVVGIGKAASLQVAEVCKIISANKNARKLLTPGLVLTKYGHSVAGPAYEVYESGHPIPDDFSVEGGKALKAFVKGFQDDCMLIVCLSGGASSLALIPRSPLTLEDMREVSTQLLHNPNPIDKVNLIRRELSELSNGGLVEASGAKTIVSLITSDIPMPHLGLVGSGPTIHEDMPLEQVVELASQLLSGPIRGKIVNFLKSGEQAKLNDKIKNALKTAKVQNVCVADFEQLMWSASATLLGSGINDVKVIEPAFNTDMKSGIDKHLEFLKGTLASKAHSWAIISGGELNVNVKGRGQGGRNTEFVLCMTKALYLDNVLNLPSEVLKELTVFSVGTDGTDARTDYAGAYVDFDLYKKSVSLDLKLDQFLANNDSMNFFRPLNALIKTGPTQTNLMDLRAIVYRAP